MVCLLFPQEAKDVGGSWAAFVLLLLLLLLVLLVVLHTLTVKSTENLIGKQLQEMARLMNEMLTLIVVCVCLRNGVCFFVIRYITMKMLTLCDHQSGQTLDTSLYQSLSTL